MARRRRDEEPLRDWEVEDEAQVIFDDDPVLDWDASSDDGDDIFAKGASAGDMFVDFCLEQLQLGRISAKTVCTLCWFASRAGAKGSVSKYALKPTVASGKFSAHVDKVTGFNSKVDGNLFRFPVPVYSKADASRGVHMMPMQLPHECLAREVEADASILERLERTKEGAEWAPDYELHPVVATSTVPVLPCSLYLDGVAVANRNGALGI